MEKFLMEQLLCNVLKLAGEVQVLREVVINLKNQLSKPEINQEIFTLKEAANFLRLSIYTLKKYVKLGKLKRALPQIKGFRFHIDELVKFSNFYRP